MRNFVFAAIKDIRTPPIKIPLPEEQGDFSYMVYKLIGSSFRAVKFFITC